MIADGMAALFVNSHLQNRLELIRALRLLLRTLDENPSVAAAFNREHVEYARLVLDTSPDDEARYPGAAE